MKPGYQLLLFFLLFSLNIIDYTIESPLIQKQASDMPLQAGVEMNKMKKRLYPYYVWNSWYFGLTDFYPWGWWPYWW
ncbi:hypothetical protein T4E_534 [Trichinella pseudospiralis]|uniref:Uncharacterized protein n=1 Tax=Trichinella pseudospiralis TaxID=6337 RepID=A0A0V0XYW1_TRIPS|nr:hypothetical protein T4E_534 [Trichinella pseudospiralis]